MTEQHPADRPLLSTGMHQETNPQRQVAQQEELDRLASYAVKSETHLWLVLLTHKASPAILDGVDSPDDIPMLDLDTLVGMPVIVCYVCEQAYEPRLRHRKCLGGRGMMVAR